LQHKEEGPDLVQSWKRTCVNLSESLQFWLAQRDNAAQVTELQWMLALYEAKLACVQTMTKKKK